MATRNGKTLTSPPIVGSIQNVFLQGPPWKNQSKVFVIIPPYSYDKPRAKLSFKAETASYSGTDIKGFYKTPKRLAHLFSFQTSQTVQTKTV